MSNDDQKKIDSLLSQIHALPSLPTLVVEILQSFDNENVDAALIARKISSDQAIVARVMRVANSPFFGLSGKIGSITEAIVVLGFNNLRGLVTSAAIINLFPHPVKQFDLHVFWRHSLGTAACAKLLAKHARVDAETAFTTGLLHDIGRLVIGVHFPQVMEKTGQNADDSTIESLQMERALMGLDHAALGGEVAKRWHFPAAIQRAIALHHTPAKADRENGLTDVIYIANLFAHALSDGQLLDEKASGLALAAQARLAIDGETLKALAVDAQQLYAGVLLLMGE